MWCVPISPYFPQTHMHIIRFKLLYAFRLNMHIIVPSLADAYMAHDNMWYGQDDFAKFLARNHNLFRYYVYNVVAFCTLSFCCSCHFPHYAIFCSFTSFLSILYSNRLEQVIIFFICIRDQYLFMYSLLLFSCHNSRMHEGRQWTHEVICSSV